MNYNARLAGLGRTTTQFRENGLRTLLLHKAGEQTPEHQTRGAITVHCLKGQVIFFSGDERAELNRICCSAWHLACLTAWPLSEICFCL